MSDIKPLLRSAKEKLAAADISEVDAEHLFAYVLGISRMDLHNSVKLEEALKALGDFGVIEDTFAKLISRRAAHEPLQYLTGISYFRHLEIESLNVCSNNFPLSNLNLNCAITSAFP